MLEETGISFRIHLITFSDHGNMNGSYGMFRKTTEHEESFRRPMILSDVQKGYNDKAMEKVSAPMNHVDIAPTTLEIWGIEKSDWKRGDDYSGTIQGIA